MSIRPPYRLKSCSWYTAGILALTLWSPSVCLAQQADPLEMVVITAALREKLPPLPPDPVPPPPVLQTGGLFVTTGFGAATITPFQCTGNGLVSIAPVSLTGTDGNARAQKVSFAYSGLSAPTPPACTYSEAFTNLRTGTWSVSDGAAVCVVTVSVGSAMEVRIFNHVCQ
jgi:hypothetical protein